LGKKGSIKSYTKIRERIGRLREKNTRVASDYCIEVIADDKKTMPSALNGSENPKADKKTGAVASTA